MTESAPAPTPTGAGRQLPLDLGHRPALGQDDFLVAASNSDAVSWIDRWPAWPGHALAIHGPPGCGKTHLAHVWQAASGARRISAGALTVEELPNLALAGAAVVVEDGDIALNKGVLNETALLHLFNMLKEQDGSLLLTGREPPSRWRLGLRDLGSRLAAVTAVEVRLPDDAFLAALVVKLFHDRQLQIEPDVVAYLVPRIERSFDSARAVIERIDREALAERRRVTVPFIRGLIGDSAP